MKPPFAYYGGKSRLAGWIASLMGAHRTYVEPFAGSAAVLFAKAPARHEILNDRDGDIVNFFDVLRTKPAELEEACRLTPYSRAEWDRAQATILHQLEDPLERARLWWVRSCQSFSQAASNNTGWSISIAQTRNRPHQLVDRIGRFSEAALRLAEVFIECDDGLKVIKRYGGREAVVYVDPPYLGSTRSAFCDASGYMRRPAGDYRYEFYTETDHRALAEVLVESPAHVLLSGYPSELYDELYAGWHRIARYVRRPSSNGRDAGNHHATEVVWSNRPLQQLLG